MSLNTQNHDVLYIMPRNLTDQQIDHILMYVQAGGGLVLSECLWGFMQLHKGENMFNYSGNHILKHVGIQFNDSYTDTTVNGGFDTTLVPSPLYHGYQSLLLLENHFRGTSHMSENDLKIAADVMKSIMYNVPMDDQFILGSYKQLFINSYQGSFSHTTKLTSSHVREKLALTCTNLYNQRVSVENVTAHPDHVKFPGIVPTNSPRISKQIIVDTKVKDWHSTGLYAAAGETIIVKCPHQLVNKNISVRIGCHSDQLFNQKEWQRAPDICRDYVIDATEIKIANAFGGLIYIDVKNDADLGAFEFDIENAVPAPYFILGVTDINEWRNSIRHYPAPWAEFQARNVIHSVPSGYARNILNPIPALLTWDTGMDYCAELAGKAYHEKRPARYVTDIQISAGYMHSGYPIMTHLDQAERDQVMNPNNIIQNWGVWHEMGHNHQNMDWTFEGTVEVTVNIFTIYVLYKFHNNTWNVLRQKFTGDHQMTQRYKQFTMNPSFQFWKNEPFVGLLMYVQEIEAFGFDSFKQVFREYLRSNKRPENDQQKRDQWLIMYSRTVGRNLSDFFDWWKIPVSIQAKQAVANLPRWMPNRSQLF
jgi:hypothetical protein